LPAQARPLAPGLTGARGYATAGTAAGEDNAIALGHASIVRRQGHHGTPPMVGKVPNRAITPPATEAPMVSNCF
jgi:hypothetical protein